MPNRKPFVLIVEDDKRLVDVLSRYLDAVGYMVLHAFSFKEAVNRMGIRPDVVILDIGLPDATGWDVAGWLGAITRPVPVIVISGLERPTQKQLEAYGAKAFLSKPFPVQDLLHQVQQYAPIPAATP